MPLDDRLFHLLESLPDDELQRLWTDGLRCKPEQDKYIGRTRPERIAAISKAWRSEHGNALRNVVRGPHDLHWKQILIDAADKLHPDLKWTPYRLDDLHSATEIEQVVLDLYDRRVGAVWDSLSPEQRQKVSCGALLPGASGVLASVAGTVGTLTADRSLATTLMLLTLLERRRLLRSIKN
jgi:hypothetical protein